MVASIRRNSKVKRQRRRTAQTCCYDGLEEVLEKASRHIKQGLLQGIRRNPKYPEYNFTTEEHRNRLPRRLSEKSKETVGSESPVLSKDVWKSNEIELAHSLMGMFVSTASERLHPSFKQSVCSKRNASPPIRKAIYEPSSSSYNKEMTDRSSSSWKSPFTEEENDDSTFEASFPPSGDYCEFDGTESSVTSIVECDFDSENFSENTL